MTDGGSKIKFIESILRVKAIINSIFVVFNYGINIDFLEVKKKKLRIIHLATWQDILDEYTNSKKLSDKDKSKIISFLKSVGVKFKSQLLMKRKKMQNQKVKKIINLIEKQKYQKAEILFRRIIREFPNDENIKYAYFDALFRMRQFDIILNFIKKNKESSDDLNILKLKALCYLEKKLPLKSIDCLQKIINLNPEPIIYNYLGIAYAKLNKKEQAEKFL